MLDIGVVQRMKIAIDTFDTESRIMPTEDGCWIWIGATSGNGYGRAPIGNKGSVYAHRLMWEKNIGPIPDGMQIDHKCQQRLCVRPYHLQLVTDAEHREIGRLRRWENETHCTHGHRWSQQNTHIRKNGKWRICLKCQRAIDKRRR